MRKRKVNGANCSYGNKRDQFSCMERDFPTDLPAKFVFLAFLKVLKRFVFGFPENCLGKPVTEVAVTF